MFKKLFLLTSLFSLTLTYGQDDNLDDVFDDGDTPL